jgi:cytochrome c biogenesis protein CcdA/thiol-disulfide isomerase/thioredoxin
MNPLLLGIGFVAGLLTIVSPCILPVLPAVLASGVASGGRRRAFAIAGGLALAFGFSALLSIRVLDALHLPLSLRRDLAIAALFVLALAFIVPEIGEVLERMFARIGGARSPNADGSGLVLGATLGLLYLPCGGPVLSAITAVGQKSGSFGIDAVALTAAYSLGIALPVFVLVLLTGRMTRTTGWLRAHGPQVRRTGGVLILASALAITFGAANTLQNHAPAFTASIENNLTHGSIHSDLQNIGNPHATKQGKRIQQSTTQRPHPQSMPAFVPMADQVPTLVAKDLPNYGPAPEFADVTKWLNTPDGSALSLSQLRGKVVLIDFWTYSCINCRRSLPHVEAWYRRYHSDGLEVIGVHTPEFDFEHSASNVSSAIKSLGVTYPVAMDNDYGTWNAWDNDSWPAEYLIDAQGDVRYGSLVEGDYGETEAAIRALLIADGVKSLPPTTDVPDTTPDEPSTPESYLGYQRLARYAGTPITRNAAKDYSYARSLPASNLSYNGSWTVGPDDILAGSDASLRINVRASDVYLVLAGSGTVTATLSGKPLATQQVAGVPTLYTIFSGQTVRHGIVQLDFSPGLSAYDFTFG